MEWIQEAVIGIRYSVNITPWVPLMFIGSTMSSYRLIIPYNTEYNFSVVATTPCRTNTTAFITLYYGEDNNCNIIIPSCIHIIIMPIYIAFVANCGYPETESNYNIMNDSGSVPNIEGYNGLPVEGSIVTFSCPPELVLTGPNSATCTGNGRWQPDPSGLMCNLSTPEG
ncbi:MAG: CCP domain-containing protein [Proteobacteria bacterium]|nr:CCP domain-containing protein [Pseudomonadota bacterium]